jgi:phospholipid/cholesterol/gamma-HCH transport system permease protein
MAYSGAVTLLLAAVPIGAFRRGGGSPGESPRFAQVLVRELYWMVVAGLPLVGLVHVAMGSFLSMQAYYGSTFVEGTGAVVGVGLLRNLGGMMTGLTLAGILAARMIPELGVLSRPRMDGAPAETTVRPGGLDRRQRHDTVSREATIDPARLAAPRITAAALASVFLAQWGVAVGTAVGWQASLSMMGLPTETFFLMMTRMMWFRDVVGLLAKGVLYGALPAAICCYEGIRCGRHQTEPAPRGPLDDWSSSRLGSALPRTVPMFRAACLSFVAILIVNTSWFILVYHAVPFYGPTLLQPPGP